MACLAVYMQQILRAVLDPFGGVAAAGAGDEHDRFRLLAVGGPPDRAQGGPGSRGQALELQAVDDILVFAVAVFREEIGVHDLEAGGQHDGAHVDLDDQFILLSKRIALVGQAFTQPSHFLFWKCVQFCMSITGLLGTACGNGT